MKRIFLVLAVAAVMAMMVGAMALPAFGADSTYTCTYVNSFGQNVQETGLTKEQVKALKLAEREGSIVALLGCSKL
jgi:hypothetical protein